MIKINCSTKDSVRLTDIVPFQGNLKKRTAQDIEDLMTSLRDEGLMMPFAIWIHDDKKILLDGHGRKEALTKLAIEGNDPDVLSVDWPCVYVEAETEDDARKALLQITSSYGKVTKAGYKQFCVSIPEYRAPSINKFVPKQSRTVRRPTSNKTVIKIRVDNDKLDRVREILGQFDFIEVI